MLFKPDTKQGAGAGTAKRSRGRGFVTELEAPEGRQRVTRCGFRFGDGNPAPSGPAPALSAQTEAWLQRLGYGGEDIQRLKNSGVV